MLCGLTVTHIRSLCENQWEGGGGYSPRDVAEWTLDQIFMRLVDKKNLERYRVKAVSFEEAPTLMDKDGLIKGRDADGNALKLPFKGKSLARRLMEEEAARQAKEKEKLKKGGRRRRRGRN